MPTYEYRCQGCGHEMEAFQSIKADPLMDCPQCHEPRLKRLIGTGAGVIFKGSGFYETDYRSEDYKKAAKAEADAAKGKTEGEGEKKSGGGESSGSGEKKASSDSGESKTAAQSEGQSTAKAEKPKGESKSSDSNK